MLNSSRDPSNFDRCGRLRERVTPTLHRSSRVCRHAQEFAWNLTSGRPRRRRAAVGVPPAPVPGFRIGRQPVLPTHWAMPSRIRQTKASIRSFTPPPSREAAPRSAVARYCRVPAALGHPQGKLQSPRRWGCVRKRHRNVGTRAPCGHTITAKVSGCVCYRFGRCPKWNGTVESAHNSTVQQRNASPSEARAKSQVTFIS